MTIALTLAAPSFVLRLAAPAYAQSPLIQGWLAANTECKGGRGDDPKTQRACETRDQAQRKAEAQGLFVPGERRLVEMPALVREQSQQSSWPPAPNQGVRTSTPRLRRHAREAAIEAREGLAFGQKCEMQRIGEVSETLGLLIARATR